MTIQFMGNKKAEMIPGDLITLIIYLAVAVAVGLAIRAIVIKFS